MAGYAIAAIFLVIVIKLSKVPFKFMVKGMKAIVFLILLTVICNLLLTPGEPLVTLWKLTITKEGLRIAALMTVRLSFLIIGSSIMTLTTTPNQLTDAMEKMMSPLKKIKVPVLVPLFISAFRRANDLAMAMEARCYRGGDKRTKMKPLHYERRDYIAYAIVVCYLVAGVAAGRIVGIL